MKSSEAAMCRSEVRAMLRSPRLWLFMLGMYLLTLVSIAAVQFLFDSSDPPPLEAGFLSANILIATSAALLLLLYWWGHLLGRRPGGSKG